MRKFFLSYHCTEMTMYFELKKITWAGTHENEKLEMMKSSFPPSLKFL